VASSNRRTGRADAAGAEDLDGRRRPLVSIVDDADGLRDVVARAREPDLVLLDIELPDVGGWEGRERLAWDRRLADVPVVALTAHGGARLPAMLGASSRRPRAGNARSRGEGRPAGQVEVDGDTACKS
jgi:CheY-like chemotaxis protein